MSISSGFFNSELGDRLYDATSFNRLVGSILVDGVIPYGGNLLVEENTGLTVNVQTGRAWFLNSWIDNDAILPVTLDAADAAYNRYDIVALDFDVRQVIRENTIVVIKGNASASPVLPTLVDTDDHKQYPLAIITVPAAATDIYQANIENKVGTEECPFASGVLQQATTEQLLAQWNYEFYNWFNNLVDQLSGEQVTSLQNQIDQINSVPKRYSNFLINGRMQIMQNPPVSGDNSQLIETYGVYPTGAPDRWILSNYNAGAILVQKLIREDFGENRRWYRIFKSTLGTPISSSYTMFGQRIEAQMLSIARIGTPDAKPLTLSFLFRANKTGTIVVELQSVSRSKIISRRFTYSTPDVTQRIVLTFDPDTTVPLGNSIDEGLRLNIWLNVGPSSVYTGGSGTIDSWETSAASNRRAIGQSNMLSAIDDNVAFTDLQLEIGSVATPYERIPDHEELARCQRYYYYLDTRNNVHVMAHMNGAPQKAYVKDAWPVPMRTIPLVDYYVMQETVGSAWYLNNDYEEALHTNTHLCAKIPSTYGSSGYTYMLKYAFLRANAEL